MLGGSNRLDSPFALVRIGDAIGARGVLNVSGPGTRLEAPDGINVGDRGATHIGGLSVGQVLTRLIRRRPATRLRRHRQHDQQ